MVFVFCICLKQAVEAIISFLLRAIRKEKNMVDHEN